MQPRSPWTRHKEVKGEQTNSSTHAYTRNEEEEEEVRGRLTYRQSYSREKEPSVHTEWKQRWAQNSVCMV